MLQPIILKFLLLIIFIILPSYKLTAKGGFHPQLDLSGMMRQMMVKYELEEATKNSDGQLISPGRSIELLQPQFDFDFSLAKKSDKKKWFIDWGFRFEFGYTNFQYEKDDSVHKKDDPVEGIFLKVFQLALKPGLYLGFPSPMKNSSRNMIYGIGPLIMGFAGTATINAEKKSDYVTNYGYGYWTDIGFQEPSFKWGSLEGYFFVQMEVLFFKERFLPRQITGAREIHVEYYQAVSLGLRLWFGG